MAENNGSASFRVLGSEIIIDGKPVIMEHKNVGSINDPRDNHIIFLTGSIPLFNEYQTITYDKFRVISAIDDSEWIVLGIVSSTSNSLVLKLQGIPDEMFHVVYTENTNIKWKDLTTITDEVEISLSLQDKLIASSVFYLDENVGTHKVVNALEVNEATNESLDRIKNVAVSVVGMDDEDDITLDFLSNNILIDNSTIKSSLEAFDTKFGNESEIINSYNVTSTESIEAQVNDLDTAIGNRVFTNDNLLVDGESITTSLDKLDTKIGKETEIITNNIVTATDNIEKQINSIATVIGDRIYDFNDILTDQQSATDSFKAIDTFIHSEFYAEEFGYPAYQSFTNSAGVSIYTLTQDEDGTIPTLIDTTKVVNNTDLMSISTENGSPIYKEGSVLQREANVVKITAYNPLTGEITLNFPPKTAFRINYMAMYNRKNVPDGKIIQANNIQNIIDNSPTNEAGMIGYDNTNSKLNSTNVQEALDEVVDRLAYDSVGIVATPTLTKNGDGTVTVGSNGVFTLSTGNTILSRVNKYDNVAQKILTPTDGATNFVYLDYNLGTPEFFITTDSNIFDSNFSRIPIVRVAREGSVLHFEEYDQAGIFLTNKLLVKDIKVNSFQRTDGLVLSTSAGRIASVSSGTVWFGVQKNNETEVTSGTVGQNLFEYYQVAGVWNKSANLTQFDSTYYSDGTDRLTLNPQKWVAKYFFRDIGNDEEIYYLHGGAYTSQLLAVNEALPEVPSILLAHSVYVGKIVVQQNATLGIAFPRNWGTGVTSSVATNHEDLSNILQAGTGITNGHISASSQTIYGEKTFNSVPKTNGTPILDTELVTKKYVDDYALEMAIVFGS